MRAELVIIRDEADHAEAMALVDALMDSEDPADVARLQAQARLIAAYERQRWPDRPVSLPDLLAYLMDQHGLGRADLVPLLGTPSRVSEVLGGKTGLSMAMVRRLRARFGIPADLLIPAGEAPRRRAAGRESRGRPAA